MADTPVLDLERQTTADTGPNYSNRLEQDRVENANQDKVDLWAGSLTASLFERVYSSGSWAATASPNDFYGGVMYNPGPGSKIITGVVATCHASGGLSSAVTRIDVRKASTIPNSSNSIFSNNVFKCILSGTNGFASPTAQTIVAASASWGPGEFLGIVIEATSHAAPAAGLGVHVHWKPSASYGG
jgi:hypothetical protein